VLTSALATTTWRKYCGYLLRFRDFCWEREISFPPRAHVAIAATANFVEAATRSAQRPASTVNSILAGIAALYEPLGLFPTRDPLITRLRKGIVRTRTKRPIAASPSFDPSAIRDLFHRWGERPTKLQLRAKLLALLCLLGAFRISATALPYFDAVNRASTDEKLVVPVVGYKNDRLGEGNTVTIFQSSDERCCPVATFRDWKARTRSIRAGVRECRLLFTLESPPRQLRPDECAAILWDTAREAGLDVAVFTPKTFRKTGVRAGLDSGIQPDAILKLGGWASAETFWHHYVSRSIPDNYTDLIFDIDSPSLPP
jgi:hypothetical protein